MLKIVKCAWENSDVSTSVQDVHRLHFEIVTSAAASTPKEVRAYPQRGSGPVSQAHLERGLRLDLVKNPHYYTVSQSRSVVTSVENPATNNSPKPIGELRNGHVANLQELYYTRLVLLMLIEIINKGSVPYYGSHVSNSTGVSLSDILFSFMLEKYIVCNVCGLRSPSIESSGVLYISPTHTSSMRELIMQGLQQKLEKSCFRCNKNTWHVESNHILQPPNYLIIVVNRFRYINNQFAKDKCSIPMDMTVVLGYHKFSLQATIDHHGPSIYSGHYTTSVNCCNRTFYCNDNKITEFDMINTKNSSTAYVVIYKLIT